MNDEFDETSGPELTADEEALLKEMPTLTDVGQARRTFLGQTIRAAWGCSPSMLLEKEQALAALRTVARRGLRRRARAWRIPSGSRSRSTARRRRSKSIRAWCCSTRCASGSS